MQNMSASGTNGMEAAIKTLSLIQPWASLVVIGAKRFETRSWHTNYRGELLIHASKSFPKWAREFTVEPVCYEAVKLFSRGRKTNGYPTGAIIGKVNLVDCITTEEWLKQNCDVGNEHPYGGKELLLKETSAQEYAFGDFSYGRFAWELADPEEFAEPIPAKGSLRLWEFNGVNL